jgi:hypothetical protein
MIPNINYDNCIFQYKCKLDRFKSISSIFYLYNYRFVFDMKYPYLYKIPMKPLKFVLCLIIIKCKMIFMLV